MKKCITTPLPPHLRKWSVPHMINSHMNHIVLIFLFIFLFKLHITPYGSSNYNTINKSMQHIKEKQQKHNKYVNVGEIFDRRGPYHLKSSDCFMKVQTTDKRSEVGLSM